MRLEKALRKSIKDDHQHHYESLDSNKKYKRRCALNAFGLHIASFFILKKANVQSSALSDIGGVESKCKDRGWKWAIDEKSQKPYFYNTKTRVVSWLKPSSFVEWKRFEDSSGKYYYYNQITKETTWNEPKEYLEADETKSVTTSVTSESLPSDKIDTTVPDLLQSCSHTNNQTDNDSEKVQQRDMPEIDNIETRDSQTLDQVKRVQLRTKNNHWQVLFSNSTGGKYLFCNPSTKEISRVKPKDFQEWITVEATSGGIYFYNILTGISTWNHPSSFLEQSERKRTLSTMISQYYIGNEFYGKQFLQKFEGRESTAIEAIKSLIEGGEESPFDERLLAVSTFIKTAVTSAGQEPYDENVDRWRVSTSDETKYGERITICTSKRTKDRELIKTSSPFFNCKTSHVSATSASSRYLSKPIIFAGSSRRTALFLYR